jgi:hypothetical protein
MILHRFDWNKESLSSLQKQVKNYLRTVDWKKTMSERENRY